MKAMTDVRRSIPTDAIPILLVDENPRFLRITNRMLREYYADDITVLGLAHGYEDALDLARRLKPRVLLLGVTQSDATAQRFITRLRAVLPDLIIILMGGENTPDARQHAIESGADAFVAKTMVDQQLFSVIWHTTHAPVAYHRAPTPQWHLAPALDFAPMF